MRGVIRRLSLLVFAVCLIAAPASAATIVVQLTFVPGRLSVAAGHASANPSGPVAVPVTVADGRGNGSGWTLRVQAPRSVRIVGVTGHCAAHSTCTLPTAVPDQSGNVVLRAAPTTGMGELNLVVTVAALTAGTPATPLSFSIS
jgi:hypothetical protein